MIANSNPQRAGGVRIAGRTPRHRPFALAAIACVWTLTPLPAQTNPSAPPGDLPSVRMVDAFENLKFDRPIVLTYPGTNPDRYYVVEQKGVIRSFPAKADATETTVFLDIQDRVTSYAREDHNEEGLLAMAFHPKFEQNGVFFIYYTAPYPRRGVLSRWQVGKDGKVIADSERMILFVDQPYGNHNGACVLFGPDGYLYISFGDGGAGNDTQDHAQNLATLLGTICRINVDEQTKTHLYTIPKDNPFRSRQSARPEVYAYGLRNVWRMSFDRETGELWAGDIGQNLWEEIDIIESGGNYGWDIAEGFHLFQGGRSEDPLREPVIEYGRDEGLSVTGGYVYRGERLKPLIGAYIYADYVTGRIWALRHEVGRVVAHKEILSQPKNIASFAEAPDGEIFALAFDGKIYRFELAQ